MPFSPEQLDAIVDQVSEQRGEGFAEMTDARFLHPAQPSGLGMGRRAG
jgi:hypothetical protein